MDSLGKAEMISMKNNALKKLFCYKFVVIAAMFFDTFGEGNGSDSHFQTESCSLVLSPSTML